jgi:hypothetical protein
VVKTLNGLADNVTLFPGDNIMIGPGPTGTEIVIAALPSGWSLTGNAGTTDANFLGTTDPRAFELRVDGARALRLEPHDFSPNLIGGSLANRANAEVRGATIGGGGRYRANASSKCSRRYPFKTLSSGSLRLTGTIPKGARSFASAAGEIGLPRCHTDHGRSSMATRPSSSSFVVILASWRMSNRFRMSVSRIMRID